jgi:hypothetical protein
MGYAATGSDAFVETLSSIISIILYRGAKVHLFSERCKLFGEKDICPAENTEIFM